MTIFLIYKDKKESDKLSINFYFFVFLRANHNFKSSETSITIRRSALRYSNFGIN